MELVHALHFAAVSGDRITLEVQERGADQLGTRNTKRLRRQGLIPGVLYGKANKAFVMFDIMDGQFVMQGAAVKK